jgi:iron complex transport system substrate-binding protein
MTAPSRIVSLLPSATEILFAIGAGDRVVGVTHECDHPEAARRLPKVTSNAVIADGETASDIDRHIHSARHAGSSIYRLDERLLSELRPDLIVTQELCDVCAVAYGEVQRAVRRLAAETLILSLEPRSLEDICASVEEVGAATGCQEGAARVAGEMRRIMATVGAMDAPEPPPRIVCIEWTDPIMVGGHWVPEMVRVVRRAPLCAEWACLRRRRVRVLQPSRTADYTRAWRSSPLRSARAREIPRPQAPSTGTSRRRRGWR